jgi:hypothetical protein
MADGAQEGRLQKDPWRVVDGWSIKWVDDASLDKAAADALGKERLVQAMDKAKVKFEAAAFTAQVRVQTDSD